MFGMTPSVSEQSAPTKPSSKKEEMPVDVCTLQDMPYYCRHLSNPAVPSLQTHFPSTQLPFLLQ